MRTPAWSYNLQANPEAEIEIGRDRKLVRARVGIDRPQRRLLNRIRIQDVPKPFALRLFKAKRKFASFPVGREQRHASAFSMVACRQYSCS